MFIAVSVSVGDEHCLLSGRWVNYTMYCFHSVHSAHSADSAQAANSLDFFRIITGNYLCLFVRLFHRDFFHFISFDLSSIWINPMAKRLVFFRFFITKMNYNNKNPAAKCMSTENRFAVENLECASTSLGMESRLTVPMVTSCNVRYYLRCKLYSLHDS